MHKRPLTCSLTCPSTSKNAGALTGLLYVEDHVFELLCSEISFTGFLMFEVPSRVSDG